MRVLALDPGTVKTGFIVWDNGVVECGELDNQSMLERLRENTFGGASICAIEMIACYGMAVGKETFETCVWIGRFMERAKMQVIRCFRKDIKLHLCGTTKAKDANIRQALIDKHGAPGTKKQPGKTYGVSGHAWAALAVADYAISISDAAN
jgi:hypothetical protein